MISRLGKRPGVPMTGAEWPAAASFHAESNPYVFSVLPVEPITEHGCATGVASGEMQNKGQGERSLSYEEAKITLC